MLAYSVDVNLGGQIPSRLAWHEAGHAVMADLCGIRVSRLIAVSGLSEEGITFLQFDPPHSAQTAEDLMLLQKHVLTLLAGKAAEERALPGITNVRQAHLYDYHRSGGARDLISHWTTSTCEGGTELASWERKAKSVFADDCVWNAVCQVASMLNAAGTTDHGEKSLDGVEVHHVLARLIPSEKREAFRKCAFG